MSTLNVKDTSPIVEDESKIEKLTGCEAVLHGKLIIQN